MSRRDRGDSPQTFTPANSLISHHERTGDVVIYSDGAGASFVDGQWLPGIRFDQDLMADFDRVRDPVEMQGYLTAAYEALVTSLE